MNVREQIAATEKRIRDEIDVSRLRTHHATLGQLLARQAIDMGETPEDVVTRTFASLAKETDPSQRRELDGDPDVTLAYSTAAGIDRR